MNAEPATWLELYWIPVGAGTRFQRASLVLYEAVAAKLARRSRTSLVHAGLAGSHQGGPFTLELMPDPGTPNPEREVTGPVGLRFAGRLRLFRYRVCLRPADRLPDQEWAVAPPVRLTAEPAVVARVLRGRTLAPAYTWGRRRPGHPEMWTSDSALSWILETSGIDTRTITVPGGCRAPGWQAGIFEAHQNGSPGPR